ncbi:DUF2637 domain-containing protein [Streptacidiphilus sp. EB103A]|uniref:DUF2637 domain-containing protein n=1 Tax=Streptacidiphilus sp. EB103A TaxID=3156275 RepID=UPI00351443D0
MTRTQRGLIAVVVTGAFVIAAIGFVGSYGAVRQLAQRKGFGAFSLVLPIGVDAGISVLLALDLLLTWLRIPFPLLRQTAWLLTVGSVVFNAAASWGDALAMGMHAIIPVLFIIVVEAARHAIGRLADITADRHMDSVRLVRWILAPVPTFALWRRMKLWELRSYDEVVALEQARMVYRTRLRARYGRNWRRTAPVEALLPLKLARYGVPLQQGAGQLEAQESTTQLPPSPPPPAVTTPPAPAGGARTPKRSPRPRRSKPAPAGATTAKPARSAKPKAVNLPPPPGQSPSTPGSQSAPAAVAPASPDHRAAITGISQAQAIRYALAQNPNADAPTLIAWLLDHGREVNRGSVFRIWQSVNQTNP